MAKEPQLRKGMVPVDFSKVNSNSAMHHHARCSNGWCSCPAIYMRKSKNRYGFYYRTYCRSCAHK
ncbi:hypothetical protein MARVELLAND_179 [Bacillus phage vB_BspM_MarvelLand]|nr:hypothetical protein MARVELLAND_179 [Bacillus phage vB_BspM_MarvelLand]